MDCRMLTAFSLKFNPLTPEVPVEGLQVHPGLQQFCWRIEHGLVDEAGVALINGDSGTGKRVALRVLAQRLESQREVEIGVLIHPSSNLADLCEAPVSGRTLPEISLLPVVIASAFFSFLYLIGIFAATFRHGQSYCFSAYHGIAAQNFHRTRRVLFSGHEFRDMRNLGCSFHFRRFFVLVG